MFYVYLLKSISSPEQTYVGFTTDVTQRLKTHNSGGSLHTNKHKSWELVVYLSFKEKLHALEFEKYLKSYPGRAFTQKHFL